MGPVKPMSLYARDALGHVGIALVVKGLLEAGHHASHVAEVGKMDLVRKPADGARHVRAHRGEVTLAEGNPVIVAGNHVDHALERVYAGDDAADSPHGRKGRIVGVQRLLDAGLLGHGDDPFEKVLQGLPEQRFTHFPHSVRGASSISV